MMDALRNASARLGLRPSRLMLSPKGAVLTGMTPTQFATLRAYKDVAILGAEHPRRFKRGGASVSMARTPERPRDGRRKMNAREASRRAAGQPAEEEPSPTSPPPTTALTPGAHPG